MKEQKEIYGIIYIVRNKINNKLYIGQTTEKRGINGRYKSKGEGIERMYNYYISDWYRVNNHLLSSIKKYGFEAFEVTEEFDVAYSKEELDKLEDMYIKIYNTINGDYGYNNKYGGANGKHLEVSKKKIGEASKELWSNIKHKEFMSESMKGENNPFYGKHHTEESRKINREKHENVPQTEASINKIKNKLTGVPKSKEHIKRMKEGKTGVSSSKRAVWCEEIQEVRLSVAELTRELNISSQNICACCKGKQKSAKGYHFRYATEEEIKEYKLKHGIN